MNAALEYNIRLQLRSGDVGFALSEPALPTASFARIQTLIHVFAVL